MRDVLMKPRPLLFEIDQRNEALPNMALKNAILRDDWPLVEVCSLCTGVLGFLSAVIEVGANDSIGNVLKYISARSGKWCFQIVSNYIS